MIAEPPPLEEAFKLSDEELEKHRNLVERTSADNALAQKLAREPDAEEKAAEARRIAGTPAGFAQMLMGKDRPLYQWQVEVLSWFEDTLQLCKGSLATPNGAGKSSVIVAALALWWISVHPQGKVVITTKDSKQLDNQIWPAIEAHKDRFPGWDFIERMVRNGRGGFIVGFTTDDPGRAEGWHKINDTTGPLLVIEDEAKSIADQIDQALDRCTYNAKLLTSSPGLTEGFFWRSHREDQPPPPIGYHHKQVGLLDCPHKPRQTIDMILAEYGPDHWFTRSTLYGEFTDADSDTLFVIPKHIVTYTMENPPRYVPGGRRAFCDFAAGRAENVFAVKVGNKIDVHAWKDPEPLRAVHQFIKLFIEYGLTPAEIYGDAGGMGIVILGYFKEQGWPIIGINNESEAVDSVKYPNIGAEMWHNAAIKLGTRGYILPNDPILKEQLTSRRAAPTTKAILGLESKKDMAKRGVASPDRGDAVVGVLAADTELANTLFDETGLAKLEAKARAERQPEFYDLALSGDRVSYQKRPDGWLKVYERPSTDRQYICVVNPRRHSEPMKDHVLIVVRAPYIDEKTRDEVPAKLVARVVLMPFKLDAKPLAMMIGKLTAWYGRCVCVPVVNDRGDVIEQLQAEHVHIYSREEFELIGSGRKKAFEFGWESDKYTVSLWMGSLAEAIREDAIVVDDINVVMQLYTMNAKDPSASREAESLGVALQLMNHATTYARPERETEAGGISQYS